jgi:hypothetical protein
MLSWLSFGIQPILKFIAWNISEAAALALLQGGSYEMGSGCIMYILSVHRICTDDKSALQQNAYTE